MTQDFKKIELALSDRMLKEFKGEDVNHPETFHRIVMRIAEVLEEEFGILQPFNLDFTEEFCIPLIDIHPVSEIPEWNTKKS
ncbi:hypothetical protein [Caulobacter phage Cr30]|uniref:hypothetical protein n=1 Tax=Caulobacter phage Cr30 TaxID=1357714 RepID=UPI0004A9B4D4|nr:hypothetical protein OZ74_gp225 [Caulobacter phage Cr30]AGS81118.1 hypothetical protein [Caulobacter phage Cr30]